MSTTVGKNAGRFVVISSPSGGGKSTIIQRLLKHHPDYVYSISATTRPPRESEANGVAYWFHSREEFGRLLDQDEFLEWEEVYGEFYGTPRKFAEDALEMGKTVVFDLDTKGALKLKKRRPETLLIFLLPPSMEVLTKRLKARHTESEHDFQRRSVAAQAECRLAAKYDFTVINDDLDEAVRRIEEILNTN